MWQVLRWVVLGQSRDPAWPSQGSSARLCGGRCTGPGDATTGFEAEEGAEPGTWGPPGRRSLEGASPAHRLRLWTPAAVR